MNETQLKAICPRAKSSYVPFLNQTMVTYGINTPLRQAAFIAQCAHESGEFVFLKEIWGPTAAQKRYEPPSDLAAKLGNKKPGDGRKYCGRGVIQLTGLDNYALYSKLMGVDLVNHPEYLEQPIYAFMSAGAFWKRNGLNELADESQFKLITKRINGGYNGYNDRLKYYEIAKKVLGVKS
jgi:putative chitinase